MYVGPSEDFTIYPVMALPPLLVGACQETVSWFATVEVAVIVVGVLGTVVIKIAVDAADARDVPAAFVARTVNV